MAGAVPKLCSFALKVAAPTSARKAPLLKLSTQGFEGQSQQGTCRVPSFQDLHSVLSLRGAKAGKPAFHKIRKALQATGRQISQRQGLHSRSNSLPPVLQAGAFGRTATPTSRAGTKPLSAGPEERKNTARSPKMLGVGRLHRPAVLGSLCFCPASERRR